MMAGVRLLPSASGGRPSLVSKKNSPFWLSVISSNPNGGSMPFSLNLFGKSAAQM